MKKPLCVTITGGAGQIGYQLLFRLAAGEVFGKDQPLLLHILELEPRLPALQGVVMELEDGAFPLLEGIKATASLKEAFMGCQFAFLVGSVPRQQGMERGDLLAVNAKVFVEQGRALNEYAAADVRVLVVGNPCNTNCMIAASVATDIPNERFFAMMMLDQHRAVSQLAAKASVPVREIDHCIVFGNHSATQFPDFTHARIQGRLATDVIGDDDWFHAHFLPTVQKRGAAIIQARGASSAASAANAAIDTAKCLMSPGQLFSLGVWSHGEYGAQEGTVVSYPCFWQEGAILVDESWQHNESARLLMQKSFMELAQERQMVLDMGLI